MYDTVLRGQKLAIGMIKAGVKVKDIHSAVVDYFKSRGFETGMIDGKMQGFIHSTGHGLGLEIHEPPRISFGDEVLEAGNVVTVEPGLYYEKIGGVRIENRVLLAPLALYLAYKRGLLPERVGQPVLGASMLGVAVLLRYIGGVAAELFTMRASLVTAVLALIVFYAGVKQVVHWWLPVALFILSIPLPVVVLSSIAFPLQLQASQMGAALLEWRQVPVLLQGKDREEFADFYRYASERGTVFYAPGAQIKPTRPYWACTAPIAYRGQAALAREIEICRAFLSPADAFLTSTAPASFEPYRDNDFYDSEEEFVYALAEAMRTEYEAIAKAGFLLQVDDAWLPALWDRIGIAMGLDAFRKRSMLRVDA